MPTTLYNFALSLFTAALLSIHPPCFADQVFPLVTDLSSDALSTPDIEISLRTIAGNLQIFSYMDARDSVARTVSITSMKDRLPRFNPNDAKLVLGPILGCPTGVTPDHLATDLHEYAHTIFTANLYKSFALLGEPTREERYNFSISLHLEAQLELEKRVSVRDLSLPFDETFADTFAVLSLEDPRAMANPLSQCLGFPIPRDFTGDYATETWQGGSLKPESPFVGAKVHEILSPIMPQLWRAYLDLKDEKGKSVAKAIVLKSFYDASVRVIRDLSERKFTYKQWFEIDKPTLNGALIKAFLEELPRTQLWVEKSQPIPNRSGDLSQAHNLTEQ